MITAPEVDRTSFIGGSDIAGILGLSRWKTPLSVWADKTGLTPPRTDKPLYLTLGTRLEEVVAELFTQESGKRLMRANARRIHPHYPMFAAQIDRLVIDEDAVFEAKTASVWKKKEWAEDEIPQEYICQVMWQLAVTGKKLGYICCLIGNEQLVTKEIKRDPVLIAEMLKRADTFWNEFVLTKIMPGQISAKDKETLDALFPNAEPESQIDLGDEGAKLIEARNAFYEDASLLRTNINQIENQLKAMLKEKEAGVAGKWKITWKNQKRKGFTVEPTEFRKFDIREVKGDPK